MSRRNDGELEARLVVLLVAFLLFLLLAQNPGGPL